MLRFISSITIISLVTLATAQTSGSCSKQPQSFFNNLATCCDRTPSFLKRIAECLNKTCTGSNTTVSSNILSVLNTTLACINRSFNETQPGNFSLEKIYEIIKDRQSKPNTTKGFGEFFKNEISNCEASVTVKFDSIKDFLLTSFFKAVAVVTCLLSKLFLNCTTTPNWAGTASCNETANFVRNCSILQIG